LKSLIKYKIVKKYLVILFLTPFMAFSQNNYQIAVLKYNGGGDWYANPTALPNLIDFCNENIGTKISKDVATVEVGSDDIFNYPFIHMTGHGNVVFSQSEAENLRNYLYAGGFLHIDDNYGMDPYVREEIKKVFPENELIQLPNNHPIFYGKFNFPNGLPKIHEHNANPPQALAIIEDGRILCLYTFESDIGDGWEDQEVHNDSEYIRRQALQMGSNIIEYVFSNN
tara:strand:- start:576 stop:1253 length:678 start_codon:yes stop_codon:yes gene_type:complete